MGELAKSNSALYGQNEALFTYKMARSFDSQSDRPDTPIDQLARDAVLTSLRQDRDENGLDPSRIDVDEAIVSLISALELEAVGSTTTL